MRALVAVLAALPVLVVPAAAGARARDRVETPVRSAAPGHRIVKESYVRLRAPLPKSDPAHPAACDWIGYLRFRDAHGPRRPRRADAVFVTMPGIFAGASMLDGFARNVVRRAARSGLHVEVWALDRRSNCLEDHLGTRVAARRHDADLAYGYYFHGRALDGRRFAGFDPGARADFLRDVGLRQTVKDEYTVIRRTMPRRLRTRKVFCGGHSLGGPLTTAFADWDLDGNPRTTRDAGWRQCAAFFALDTRLSLAIGGGGASGGSPGSPVGLGGLLGTVAGAAPYDAAPPFGPETIGALGAQGVAAFFHPGAVSDAGTQLPRDANFDTTFRLLLSQDPVDAVTQVPSVRDFRFTNQVALGAIFDDNSSPIVILRTSVGTFGGGPVEQKSWPAPYGQTLVPMLIDGKRLMIPTAAHGPLYRWVNYDRVGRPGAPRQVDAAGHPFTSARSEVTDIRELARVQFEAPADFAEQYFPLCILEDDVAAAGGDRSGDLAGLRYDGISKRPTFYADAEQGIEAGAAAPPRSRPPTVWVKLPGYNHIDVGTAAWRQNGGRPERESLGLVRFARRVLRGERRR